MEQLQHAENKNKRKRSITFKINFSVLVILIPALIILILIACLMAASSVTQLTDEKISAQTEVAVNSVDDFFRNKMTAVSMFENNAAMQAMLEDGTTKEKLESTAAKATVIKILSGALDSLSTEGAQASWIASKEADVYVMSTGEIVAAGLKDVDWDDRVLKEKKALVSEPFLDPVTNKTVISIVGPIFSQDGKEIVGYAGFDVFQDNLTERLSTIKIGREGFLDLISNSATYIYSGDNSVIGKSLDDVAELSSDYKQKATSDYVGTYNYHYGSTEYYAQFQLSETTEWLAISNIPTSEINATRDTLVIVLVCVTAGVLAILIITLIFLIKRMVNPLKQLTGKVEDFAQGDLNVDISIYTNDEIGTLADSVKVTITNLKEIIQNISYMLSEIAAGNLDITVTGNYIGDFRPIQDAMIRITDALNHTLGQINQSADQVSSGSDQVSSGAQALSQGATEQASSVEELAATIEEISNQVKDTASNAVDAREKSNKAGAGVMSCNEKMQEMIHAMDDITQKSNEIEKIIKNIEDIAFQTNILALNAAVEAARAGEAGKGFAVVADEVRNLASKSAEASQNTSTLIAGSIEAVERGTRIAEETANALLQVVSGAQKVEEKINIIAGAAGEQANSIAQVTQGVEQISSVVQTNSATAEESAAASEELSGQAQMLKSLVRKFKLRGQKNTLDDFLSHPDVPSYPEDEDSSFDSDKY